MAKILLLQTDQISADALEVWLSSDGSHAVDVRQHATDGGEGIELGGYDLIVDCQSSQQESAVFCRSTRRIGVHTPILIISEKPVTTTEKVAVLDSGADDILTRPLNWPEVSARIRALLRRPKLIVPRRINIGDITLDTAVKCVFQSGQRIDLSDREYALLELLARNANRVLSLDEIVDRVSSCESKVCASFVKVLVHRVRLKLRSAERSIVENVHGRGYVVRCQNIAGFAETSLLLC